MKQIIPFKKDLSFNKRINEITSISLERKIDILEDGIISGIFYITGDYKMNEGSINREDFSFELPFDVSLDPRYDISSVKCDVEDFYYDVINDDTLRVNIDLYVEAEYLEDDGDIDNSIDTDNRINNIDVDSNSDSGSDNDSDSEVNTDIGNDNDVKEDDRDDKGNDLFNNLDSSESYVTYFVYIVKDDDTIDKIMSLYEVSKDDIEAYNDISSIKMGDKIIIPKSSN